MQDKVICDCAKRKVNKRVWSLSDYNKFFSNRLLSIHDILRAKYVSVVILIYLSCGYVQVVCTNYVLLSSFNCFR